MTANVALTDTFDQWRVKDNELIIMTQPSGMNNFIKVLDTANSTSTTTGSIITQGGIGIGKSVQIGKDLEGKINIYCGDMDNYYLNNAVVLTEEFLESTTDPYYNGEVDYGDMAEHCWNGDQENPNHISRLRYNTMYIPKIRDRLKKTAPKNNNLKNWGI